MDGQVFAFERLLREGLQTFHASTPRRSPADNIAAYPPACYAIQPHKTISKTCTVRKQSLAGGDFDLMFAMQDLLRHRSADLMVLAIHRWQEPRRRETRHSSCDLKSNDPTD